MSPLEDGPSTGLCFYLRIGKMEWYRGAPSDLQGGSCYLLGRPEVHKGTAYKQCQALQALLSIKMQSCFMFFSVLKCFSLNANYTLARHV